MGTTTFNLELTNQQVINMVKEVVFRVLLMLSIYFMK